MHSPRKKKGQVLGFDTQKYLDAQTRAIMSRVEKSGNKLYLEFGGKLCYDYHAARVLPGYDPEAKVKMFQRLRKDMAIVYCVGAKDIEKGKVRFDFGLTYDQQTLKDISDIRERDIPVHGVVITRFEGEERAVKFRRRLENLGIKVYVHTEIKGYPNDIDLAVSDRGYGAQPYVDVKKPIVVVTGPGPGSGKMSFCLTQMYHDHKRGLESGFAKFETFPIWNLPLNHPVNIAYEAATADLGDFNMVDPFHLKAYRKKAVNYNRDIENFGILLKILKRIAGDGDVPYRSPTGMGVNTAGSGIINDDAVREASRQEIIRRYFRYRKEVFTGIETPQTLQRINDIMEKAGVKEEDRNVVGPARKAAIDAKKGGKGNKGVFCGAALEMPDGRIVTGKNSPLLHAESALILNALKEMSNIPDKIHLLPPAVIGDIRKLKTETLGDKSESLNLNETLIALSIGASSNHVAETCLEMLKKLRGCEMHTTHMPTEGDEAGLRKLGLNVTTDAKPGVKYADQPED
ncbi:MAG: DUF1846 domain-containing protein [Candidatus Aenigmatarchaeota archaeon]|nr:MAG: DUF1846 domain-containing protein [Candidatus Aenigmarchaeota archaeon]